MKLIEKLKRALASATIGLLLAGFLPTGVQASVLPNIVINEIQTAGNNGARDEFVELYNAGNTEVSLETLKLSYAAYNEDSWDNYVSFDVKDKIPAKGSFLIATDTNSDGVTPDVVDSLGLAPAGGHLAIRKGNEVLDKVGWGTAQFPDAPAAPAPAAGQSIERTNGVDTDNNAADFTVRTTPTPTNSFYVAPPGDTENPEVGGVEDGGEYTEPVTPCLTDNSGEVTATLNGESFTSCTTVSDYGTYELIVTDGSGNSVTIRFTIIDKEAPATPTHVDPVDSAFVSATNLTKIDWTDVTDPSAPVTYQYESSNLANVDLPTGDFVTPVYKSDWLPTSEIPTPGTPDGVYYWHVRAKDTAGNVSLWSTPWMITVDSIAPVVNELADVRTNKEEIFTLTATDANEAFGLTYSWSESTGKVVFDNTNTHEVKISATQDGVYAITVRVTDRAGNEASQELSFEWDTTVNPVTELVAMGGENVVDLLWTNPTDSDLESIKIYRSLKDGELGDLQATLVGGQTAFTDNAVLPGVTYYYTVVAYDDLENESLGELIEVTTKIAGDNEEDDEEASVVSAPLQTSNTGAQNRTVAGSTKQDTKKEVKAAIKEEVKAESKDNEDQNTSLPAWGIALLALVGLLGLYLLWNHYPEMSGWLLFWKKKKKNNGNKLK